ncbi:MAG: hypothetical protein ACOX5R_14160 [bacterium]|jgi:hypothetical protein
MRAFLIIFSCAIVVGITVFVVMNAPNPNERPSIQVARVELDRQPDPILQSDPIADRILDFFPEPTTPLPLSAPDTSAPVTEEVAQEEPLAKKPVSSMDADLDRLMAIIHDWDYVGFNQMGTDKKMGRIHRVRENEFMDIFEGQVFESGVEVQQLSREAATLRLREAVFNLPLAQKPEFFEEVAANPRPLTPEEQKQAYEYYRARFGEKFKTYNRNYKPPEGLKMPQPITPEQFEQGMQEYQRRYGTQFAAEQRQFAQPIPQLEEQKQNFERYWKQFHPNKPMPDFNSTILPGNQPGTGVQMQPMIPTPAH